MLPQASAQPPRDHAPAGAREQVRQAMADEWQEPVRVLYLRRVRTKYEVPGRREDGTEAGKHLIRRFLRNLARVPLLIVILVFDAALNSVGNSDIQDAFGTISRRGAVRCKTTDCAALKLGDTANAAQRDLWLAWSDHHFALVRAGAGEVPRVLYSEEQAPPRVRQDNRPASNAEFVVRWRDGSCVEMHVDRRERRRYEQCHGHH
jgi:hypothetical protein